jgi:hypothetical protein
MSELPISLLNEVVLNFWFSVHSCSLLILAKSSLTDMISLRIEIPSPEVKRFCLAASFASTSALLYVSAFV